MDVGERASIDGRVCIIRDGFYPLDLNLRRDAETLVRSGCDVGVICLRAEGEPHREGVEGVEVYRMPIGQSGGKFRRFFFEYNAFFVLSSLRLLFLHLRNRFDIIQVNTIPDYLVFTALVPRLMGARVILCMREPVPELYGTIFQKWYWKLLIRPTRLSETLSLRFADHVLTVTREMRDNLARRGADVNKISVIVNVPDDTVFRTERYGNLTERLTALKKEERRGGVFRIFCRGAIEERCGLDVVIRAVARLKERLPSVQFRFMGEGDYLDRVLSLAETLRVRDAVRYLGSVSTERAIEEILAADICVVPDKRNSYSVLVHPGSIYEYIALERPVIASRLDSVASYFPENSIVYFEPDNDADLADRVHYVFAHPEEMERRRLNTKEIYETYRWERERKKYLGVCRMLLDRREKHDHYRWPAT